MTLALAEGRRRLAWLLVLLALALLGTVGEVWDIQWHIVAGRDRFWTPPHVAMYVPTAVGGALLAWIALVTSWRYRRGAPGVDPGTTVGLGPLRAPAGLGAAGLAVLVMVTAAPLDDYWHSLYGMDVELWAPFHVMGLSCGILVRASLSYAAFALARGWPELALAARPLGLGFLVLFCCSALMLAMPSAFDPVLAWPWGRPLPLYPPLVGFAAPFFLFLAARAVPGWGGATALALLFTGWRWLVTGLVPLLVAWQLGAEGLTARASLGTVVPTLTWPALLLLPALLIEWLAWGGRPAGAWIPLSGAAATTMLCLLEAPWLWLPLATDVGEPRALLLASLPLAAGLGALGATLGARGGEALRRAAG